MEKPVGFGEAEPDLRSIHFTFLGPKGWMELNWANWVMSNFMKSAIITFYQKQISFFHDIISQS